MRKARSAVTLFACHLGALLTCSAILYGQDATQVTAPSEAEQQRMISSMRKYADSYINDLPNFICKQVTEQFEAGKKGNHWHKDDTVTSRVVFNNGHEDRTLELINNKPANGRRPRASNSLSTEGEFGILLSRIFDESSRAAFSWSGWETIGGRQLARFDYSIAREHSTMRLTNYVTVTVPYHGSISIDSTTGAVWRVTSATSDIPDEVQIKSIATVVDYSPVTVGAQSSLLPVSASVLLVSDKDQVRHEMQFQGYRKFEAQSTLSFGSEDGAAPKPNEKPPQVPR